MSVDGIRLAPTTDRGRVNEIVRELQPRTIEHVAALDEVGIGRRHRVWLAEADGELLGLVSVIRSCRDRWYAAPLLLDDRAAAAIGAVIDAGPAWGVFGSLADVQPLYGRLRRQSRTDPVVGAFFYGFAPIPDFIYVDSRIRQAQPEDLGALDDLFVEFELDPPPTVPRARRAVRQAFARGPLLVAEVEGSIVGAIRVDSRTDRFLLWGGQTVLPEHRGSGLGVSLMMHAIVTSRQLGLGACGFRADTNPLSFVQLEPGIDMGVLQTDVWAQVNLREPVRFRGHGRARRMLERIEGPVQRRRPETGHRAFI